MHLICITKVANRLRITTSRSGYSKSIQRKPTNRMCFVQATELMYRYETVDTYYIPFALPVPTDKNCSACRKT